MRRSNQKSSRRGSKIPQSLGTTHPPEYVPTRVVKCKYRFKATALSAADQITVQAFGDLLCVASAAAAAYQLGNWIKIHKLEIWAPMASDLVPVTCSIEWNGTTAGLYGKSVIHSDTSMGANAPAHLMSRPPAGSQVAMWLSTGAGATNVCKLQYPANSIIDVVYSLVLRDDGLAVAVTGAVAGATTGATYVRALNSPTSTNLVPLSVATI